MTIPGIFRIILLSILTHTAYKGSKVLMSLSALELGANEFFVGMIFSTYALFPLLLSVYAGKASVCLPGWYCPSSGSGLRCFMFRLH